MHGGKPDRTLHEHVPEPRRPRVGRARSLFHRAFAPRATAETSEFRESGVGRLLCATRMRLGKDLQHIGQVLHIRYTYLVAIEDGRYEDLPGQAYAIGFVRAYADHLGIDGDEVVRRFKEESTGLRRKAALDFPIPTPDSGIPSGLSLLAAVALGMTIYASWYVVAKPTRTFPLVREVPSRLAPPVEQPAAPNEQTEGAAPRSPASAAGETPSSSEAAPVIVAVQPLTDVLELRAKVDSWIQVHRGDQLLLTKLLHKGDTYRVPERGLTLTTANAGGLDVVLNGEVMSPLGDSGAVASGVPLEPEHFKPATN